MDKKKHLYVIKYNNDCYWTGYNNYSNQLRLAKIYTSLRHCKEAADDSLNRLHSVNSYKIYEVELNIIGEVDIEHNY